MIDLSNRIILHPECERTLTTIARIHKSAKQGRKPETLRLFGTSGVGKSSLLKLYRDRHPPEETRDGVRMPVVYLAVSSQPTPKQFAAQFLDALGLPGVSYGGLAPYVLQIKTLIREMGGELALIDESQHFVDRGREKTRVAMADLVKEIVEAIEIPVVIAGAPRMELLFSDNTQLRRRFYATQRLRPFAMSRKQELRGFVHALAEELSARDRKWLTGETVTARLFFATDGVPANIVSLVQTADRIRIADTPLNLNVMSAAFREAIWLDPGPQRDPFGDEFAFERLTRPLEPFAPNHLDGDNHEGSEVGSHQPPEEAEEREYA